MVLSRTFETTRARLEAWTEAHPLVARWLLAGPIALGAAVATLAAMPLWLPAGDAGIDNIALPLILLPLIWAVPFFYACLEENLVRGGAVLVGAAALQGTAVLVSV